MKRLETRIWRLIVPVNIIFLVIGLILICLSIQVWAGEKEELQWKARALVAEYQLKQEQFTKISDQLKEFIFELSQKGLEIRDGVVVEKLKIESPLKESPKKEKK